MGHPDIARDRIPAGTLITGQNKRGEEITDSLEQLYPVIDVLKPEEWSDIPATRLTNLPTTLLDRTDRERIPKTYQEAVSSKMVIHWIEACQMEHAAMITNNVYTWSELPSIDIVPLPSKWLFVIKRKVPLPYRLVNAGLFDYKKKKKKKIKRKVDGSIDKFKARIVAGGHRQREGLDFHETYAPVAKFVSLRILLTMAALDDLEIDQCDIVTALLYGDLDEVVYVRAPAGINPQVGQKYITAARKTGYITEPKLTGATGDMTTSGSNTMYLRLHKSLYGLRQAPRCFYRKLDGILASHGYRRIPADYGVLLAQNEVVLIVHVDDMQMIGTEQGIKRLKGVLESKFMIKCLGSIGDNYF